MKVLLIKDVYKLGRAGDAKRVADGYGRNFLIPQGLAVLATPGALKQSEKIRQKATEQRDILNEEMGVVAEHLKGLELSFASRAGETGKLYGSITSQEIVDAIQKKTGYAIKRQQLDMQPLRNLGEHKIHIRLTMDLIPEIKVVVYREGEAEPSLPIEPKVEAVKAKPVEAKPVEAEPEPVEAEPVKAEPVEAEPEPVEVEPVEAEPEPVEAEPVEAKPEPVEAEPVEAKPEPVEAEPVEAEAEPAEAEPTETMSEAETGETAEPTAEA
jgi:large subunit ribosomal protein L9